jgi:hypothetical protein
MPTRWFNLVVVMFWLATMMWLAITKVLPPLRVGEPPTYRSILAQEHGADPVGWLLRLNDETLGWAATRMVRRPDGMTVIQGRVFLQELPLDEMGPGWLNRLIKPLLRPGSLELDARSRVDIDPLGRLTGFETRVQIADLPDAIRIHGVVDGTQLHISVSSGDSISYKEDRYLPPGAFVGDELLPQSTLPGLRVGQTWTMPVYSPLRPHKNPIEVLQATVEGQERILWNGEPVESLLVVYRADSGSGLTSQHEPRGKLWVRPDGEVVRQQIMFFNSPLWFGRLTPEQCELLADHLGSNWGRDFSMGASKRLLKKLTAPPTD